MPHIEAAQRAHCFMDMLAAILIGATVLTVLSLGSALLLYAHLTGRLRKPVAIGAIAAGIAIGVALLAGCVADGEIFRRLTFPIGVFLLLAGAVSGFVMLCQGPGRTVARSARRGPPEEAHRRYAA